MKNTAIISQGPGEPFQEGDLEVPELGPHDLLVEVQAVSMNPIDTKRRRLAAPGSVLGWDAVGVVREFGSQVVGFKEGQEVFYAGQVDRPGSNQRFHAVDARIVAPKPHSLSVEQAAAMPLTSLTAWESLFSKLKLQPNSTGTLVVVGAAGGVGSVLVQLAKQLTRVTVIALASREKSADWLRELGADHVVNYKDEDYVQQVKD
ncbi:zinc-binding dehydrogenase [Corynebacterium sp. 35RC1]|nr:zinc-binding dehydrogenase [Corynebacterium sp. 35RC1]